MLVMLAVLGSLLVPADVPARAMRADGGRGDVAVRVTIGAGTVSAPDSLPRGWTRLRMLATAPNHAPALFRLPAGTTTPSRLAAFLANLDTAAATPEGALAMGGRIAADSGDIVVDLTPGRYVFTCLTKDDHGHRHGIAGESRLLTVTRARVARSAVPPRARVSMKMTDFAYIGADQWPAGSYLIRVENVGRQDHQFRVTRLPAGVTPEAVARSDDPRKLVIPVTGIGRMGRSVTYVPAELTPGTYMLFCLVHDPATGRTHDKLGMYRVIRVR